MLVLRSNLQRVITAARGLINDLEKEDIEARTSPHSAGRRAKANIIRVAGAAVHGRVKRSRHRGALAGAKAPGAHEPDAFDEAAGERSPRREGVGDDDLARQGCQRHRHRSRRGGQKPRPRRSGFAEGHLPMTFIGKYRFRSRDRQQRPRERRPTRFPFCSREQGTSR